MIHPVRVGIGGWKFPPWRGSFYPEDLRQREELSFASRHVSAIEVNSTYYRMQKPSTFVQWREQTPDGFVFCLKAPRHATQRRVLAQAQESIARFVDSGITELGDKLGPILWQLPPTHAFQADDLEAFLGLLPAHVEGHRLQHVLEVRHPSFATPAYLALARHFGVATVFTDSDKFPSFADLTAPGLVYLRLMRARTECVTGYSSKALDGWSAAATCWANGGEPDGLARIESPAQPPAASREVFVFFIDGAKERAPAAAMGVLARLGLPPRSPA